MGLDQKRLRFVIRDASDPEVSFHFFLHPAQIWYGTENFYIVDRAAELPVAVRRHPASSRPR